MLEKTQEQPALAYPVNSYISCPAFIAVDPGCELKAKILRKRVTTEGLQGKAHPYPMGVTGVVGLQAVTQHLLPPQVFQLDRVITKEEELRCTKKQKRVSSAKKPRR